MGTSWYSEAELVSQEPEVIKSLIEEIIENEDVTTSVCDLEIRGNSIFFNSKGYGCYGTDFEDENSTQLFEQLFERYNKALIAFEHVHPCQSQGYHFNAMWTKPDREVDWEDETTYKIFRRMVSEETDPDDGGFDIFDAWHTGLDSVERNQKQMPMLYALVQRAKAEGFDGWGNGQIGNVEQTNFLSYNILWELIDKYWDEETEDGNSIYSPSYDADRDMAEWVKAPDYNTDADFELPSDFPELQTNCAWS